MPYIGNKTADTTLVEDNSITSAKIVNDSVIESKLNLISTSSVPSLEAKGDGSSQDGYIQLNCSQNSHGIKIKSAPHSANASYTLTLPNNDGDANQFLQTDGNGVLSFADAGTDNSPAFHSYANASFISVAHDTYQVLACPNEAFDTGNAYSTSDYKFTPQTAGKYFFYANVVWDGNINSQGALLLQKNGSFNNPEFLRNTNYATATSGVHVSGMFTMNGSSDFVQAKIYHQYGSSVNLRNQPNENNFGGFLVTTT